MTTVVQASRAAASRTSAGAPAISGMSSGSGIDEISRS